MNYYDLLDLKKQSVIDEVYKRYRNDDNGEELDRVYQEIIEKKQSKANDIQMKYEDIMGKVSNIMKMIGSIILMLVLMIGIASIVGVILYYILIYAEGGFSGDELTWSGGAGGLTSGIGIFLQNTGISIYNVLFAPLTGLSAEELLTLNGLAGSQAHSLAGMEMDSFALLGTIGFSFLFLVALYIFSIVRKNMKKPVEKKEEAKKQIALSLSDSYYALRVSEDDSWNEIKDAFQKLVQKKRNQIKFDRYYTAYLQIFDQYQSVEGKVSTLTTSQKIMLYVRTLMNGCKNILGVFSKPLFFIGFLLFRFAEIFEILAYYAYNSLQEGGFFAGIIISLSDFSYNIISQTPLFGILDMYHENFAKFLSLVFMICIISCLYSIVRYRIKETIRQYYRRLNFYLKKNSGIYDDKKKYSKEYKYGLDFVLLVILVGCYIAYLYYGGTPIPLS